MKAVWKFPLPYRDGTVQRIGLPVGAEILHVDMQHGLPMMWALVDPHIEKIIRTFRIVGTGHDEVRHDSTYIGTAIDGVFVWHFFEEPNL